MVYPTPALHLLISAPGDVPLADMAVIRKTISQWNLTLGRYAGLTVLPVSWTEHAVSELASGRRPARLSRAPQQFPQPSGGAVPAVGRALEGCAA